MTAAKIEVYTTSWCSYCDRARQLLHHKGLSCEEIDIEVQPERRAEMIRRSGRRTVPQIFIRGQHIGGCDDLYALEEAGDLESLLAGR